MDIKWESEPGERFYVRIVMGGTDRRGLFADMASTISQTNTNIRSADLQADDAGMKGQFVVEVENLTHLNRVLGAIRKVKGVISVERREQVDASDLEP